MIIYEAQVSYSKKEIETFKISNVETAYEYLQKYFSKIENPTLEHIVFIGLNARNFVICAKALSTGHENQCLVSIKEIFSHAILNKCHSFVISHNHPSGDPQPSSADHRITTVIREASKVMDINFYDHIIIGLKENDPLNMGYYSFRSAGII